MNWRNPEDYRYTVQLNAAHWAWELLRRNPEYRKDYAWFIATWNTLEQRYGRAPDRDYSRWKQDPLAWRRSACRNGSAFDDACAPDGENLQIECWMGQKWGFYKFPLDSSRCAPLPADELGWREVHTGAIILSEDNITDYLQNDTHAGLGFDLSLPLKQQFEDARKMLAILQRQLARRTPDKMRTVQGLCARWTLLLRILDGLSSNHADEVGRHLLNEGYDIDFNAISDQARQLIEGGYRDILSIPER